MTPHRQTQAGETTMDDRNYRYAPRDDDNSRADGNFSQDYGSERDYSRSSAHDYAASGQLGGERSRYGSREQRDYRDDWRSNRPDWQGQGQQEYGSEGDGRRGYGERSYGERRQGRGEFGRGQDRWRGQRGGERDLSGYDRDRGFFDRAGDEVRTWFGDEEAERRREMDQRYDEVRARQEGRDHGDNHYGAWRRSRIDEFDRDYDEYRRENSQRFVNEFDTFRTERTQQRESLRRVTEHMEVVGSDDSHVGTVDKVRGDRIVLTKNDADADGRHHSIPSRWIQSVDDKVRLRKTAEEAQSHWRDEEGSGALFGENGEKGKADENRDQAWSGGGNLNRSFSGTYRG
jgi:osmotically-inducible protein OsmY